ncbi:MAG: choice-of-anchor Q domain-containing protein [Thermoanaerobaculia bacterium]
MRPDGNQIILLASLLLAGLYAPRLEAATNTITTLVEDAVVNGNCTLREALLASIQGAAVDQCAGDSGPDTIVLAAVGTYELDDGDLPPLSGGALEVLGAPAQPRSAYLVDLGDQQRFLHARSGATLRLENLELTRGSGASMPGGLGGGALLVDDAALTMENVRISASHSSQGAGVDFVSGWNLDLLNVEFAGNFTAGGGSSTVGQGGGLRAIEFSDRLIRLRDVRFVGNRLADPEPAATGFGGGLYLLTSVGSTVELRKLRFQNNFIETLGGASSAGMYGIIGSSGSHFEFSDGEFRGNRADPSVATVSRGSAFSIEFSNLDQASLRRLLVIDNGGTSAAPQAALYARFPTAVVASDLLIAGHAGGGLFLGTSSGSCSILAGNLTVAGHPESGVVLDQGSGSIRLENSIVFGNGTVNGSDVESSTGTPDVAVENLIGIDPLFVNSGSGDYELQALSPAIDAGDATFASVGRWDLAHAPRVVGSDLDLGALERGGIFGDGFETGDFSSWGVAGPGSFRSKIV